MLFFPVFVLLAVFLFAFVCLLLVLGLTANRFSLDNVCGTRLIVPRLLSVDDPSNA